MIRVPGEGGVVRHGRHFLGAAALGLVAVLAVDGVVAWSVWTDRDHHLNAAAEVVNGQSAMYETFTRHVAVELDQLLLVLGDRMHAGEEPGRLAGLVNDLIDRSPVIEWATLIDGDDETRFSGASASAPRATPLTGACHPGEARLGVVASSPRDQGPRFLSLCRTFSDSRTATQLGISLARMAVFFADSRDARGGWLELSLADGTELFSLASGGRRESAPPPTARPVAVAWERGFEGVPSTKVVVSEAGGTEWLVAERFVTGYPFVVTVRMPLDQALEEWSARAATWSAIALAFNGGFVALMAVLWRHVRKAEDAARRLIASELQASAVFDQAFQIIILLDRDGRVRRVNDTAAEVLGFRPGNLIGRPLWEGPWAAALPDIRERELSQLKAAVEAAVKGGIARYEARPAVTESGAPLIFDMVVKPVRDADGTIAEVMLEGRDVTEATRTRETLMRTERMAALGGLVAGIAHEINTPIGVATTSASYLVREVEELRHRVDTRTLTASRMEEFLGAAEEAASLTVANCGRAAQLIHSFKQVAVDQIGGERRRFNLATYIDEILVSLRPRLKREPHKVEVECPPDLELDTDPGALSHSLTNLLVNALVHAFAPGQVGTIRITVRALDGDMVKLVFSDDGVGIPKSVQEKVFDPFFTTKRGAGGSGLGLHIVHTAVTVALRGSLRLVSDGGRGTAFVMTFPRVPSGEADGRAVGAAEEGRL